MIEPYGAFLIGSLTGVISTVGYKVLQPYLYNKLKLHDTCGVNNLHGMPGIISGVLSIIFCYMATEEIYGPSLYIMFPLGMFVHCVQKVLLLRLVYEAKQL